MRNAWLFIIFGLVGCAGTPSRQMRQPIGEEFAIPPQGTYTTPPDVPRDSPLLAPKKAAAPMNAGGPGAAGSPMPGPGGPPGAGGALR